MEGCRRTTGYLGSAKRAACAGTNGREQQAAMLSGSQARSIEGLPWCALAPSLSQSAAKHTRAELAAQQLACSAMLMPVRLSNGMSWPGLPPCSGNRDRTAALHWRK